MASLSLTKLSLAQHGARESLNAQATNQIPLKDSDIFTNSAISAVIEAIRWARESRSRNCAFSNSTNWCNWPLRSSSICCFFQQVRRLHNMDIQSRIVFLSGHATHIVAQTSRHNNCNQKQRMKDVTHHNFRRFPQTPTLSHLHWR